MEKINKKKKMYLLYLKIIILIILILFFILAVYGYEAVFDNEDVDYGRFVRGGGEYLVKVTTGSLLGMRRFTSGIFNYSS